MIESSFTEWLKNQVNKTTDNQVDHVIIKKVKDVKEKSFADYISEANPQVYTARIIHNEKYLIYNGKYLNITNLKKELDKLYTEQGLQNYGFSKLSESELIRYKRVKNIIIPYFFNDLIDEIDPVQISTTLFNNEFKNFDWQPEEIIK